MPRPVDAHPGRAGSVTLFAAALVAATSSPAFAAAPERIVPTVASAPAADGGTWRTQLVVHNPSAASARAELTFHPSGQSPSTADPVLSLELAAGESRTIGDLLVEGFHLASTSGSLDVHDVSGEPLVLDVSVYREACGGGRAWLDVPVVRATDALAAGSRADLVVPGSAGRFNVGARGIGDEAASLAFTVRDARGVERGNGSRSIGAGVHVQASASDFTGVAVSPGDSVTIDVLAGKVFAWGTPIDATSGDGSYQSARPIAAPFEMTSDFTPPTGREGNAAGGPGVMRLMTATSADGLAFDRTGVVVTDQGDVPDLVVDGRGRVYLYYVGWTVGTERNKVCVAVSPDRGRTWVYKKAILPGFEGMSMPVDPDVQVLPDGTFRIYVTSAEGGDFSKARTYVAEGTDGIGFERVGVAFTPPSGVALDPSTVPIGSTWHLFSGGEPFSNWHATSTDGRTFSFAGRVAFAREGVAQMMANGVPVDGGARFYTFDAVPPQGSERGIGSAFSSDGTTWVVESGRRLAPDPTASKESDGVKDPAVARLPDGSYLMVYATRIP